MAEIKRCEACGIIPVVVLENVEDSVPTAKALMAGGVDVMEITLRTTAGLESIRKVSENCPDMLVGAGTVLTLEQAKACVTAGAKFLVSPGYDEEQVRWCVENNVPILPGCVTPTEIMAGLRQGIRTFKFFPSNVYGGIKAMTSLAAPFGMIRFVPTGGISAENMVEYLSAPCIAAVGGSWVCTKSDIASGNFARITELCRQARQQVLAARG